MKGDGKYKVYPSQMKQIAGLATIISYIIKQKAKNIIQKKESTFWCKNQDNIIFGMWV